MGTLTLDSTVPEAPASHAADAPAAQDVFIARQPILDAGQRVVGYELLFRASAGAQRFTGSGESATATVITHAVCTFGLDVLTHGRLAFINLTRGMLVEGIPSSLPPRRVVLELLEDIDADDEVLAACRALKREGYTLALDDFVPRAGNLDLIPFASFVKMGFLETPDVPAWTRAIANGHVGAPPFTIAEQIETPDDFQRARDLGLTHFQGYFFGRPATQKARGIPASQLGYFRLLQALRDPDLGVREMEMLIKPDAALCYRVLRTVNSAAFGLRTEVSSIGEALVMLGREPVRRWVSVWAMAAVAQGSNTELLMTSIVRARFCELAGAATGSEARAAEGFLLGMCSLLDAIFDAPMATVVSALPLAEPVRAALLGDDNHARRLLDCVIAYERGDWPRVQECAARAGVPLSALPAAAADAMRWANEASDCGAADASR